MTVRTRLNRVIGAVLSSTPLTLRLVPPLRRWHRARRHARLYEKYRDATMVPPSVWYDNLALCDQHGHAPGCIVECGVWRGGMSAGMAEVLGPGRSYYLFDSFEGLPPADGDKDGAFAVAWQTNNRHNYNNCRADIDEAATTMSRAGVVAPQLIQGWFKDTLPGFAPPEPIRILRLDGDWYDSTRLCLETLYPHVAPEGLVLIDDYYSWSGCARAVHDYLAAQHEPDRLRSSPQGVAYLLKGRAAAPRASRAEQVA
jgi:O-methyltransferase